MTYNPETQTWEGNDNDLDIFGSPPRTAVPHHLVRDTTGSPLSRMRDHTGSPLNRNFERECGTPRPALITNIGSAQNIQRNGNMVFDPKEMRWHEINAVPEEDEDVFKDVPDIETTPRAQEDNEGGAKQDGASADWLVGEEFDVGPEFVRRQREEEERWRKKCSVWIGDFRDADQSWRWAIREVVADGFV